MSTSMLTRMLVPKPKNAFQSPDVQSAGLNSDLPAVPVNVLMIFPYVVEVFIASSTAAESATQPKMPPWALIIFRPIS